MTATVELDPRWARLLKVVTVVGLVALVVGLALSYSAVYALATLYGYGGVWLDLGGVQVRPAHLYPLTLDLPVLVGYAASIALAGRRSASYARSVLWVCGGATVAAQVLMGSGLTKPRPAGAEGVDPFAAVIHGWPPALAILTTHLVVLMVQALGVFPALEGEQAARPWAVIRFWRSLQANRVEARRATHQASVALARVETDTTALPALVEMPAPALPAAVAASPEVRESMAGRPDPEPTSAPEPVAVLPAAPAPAPAPSIAPPAAPPTAPAVVQVPAPSAVPSSAGPAPDVAGLSKRAALAAVLTWTGHDVPATLAFLAERGVSADKSDAYKVRRQVQDAEAAERRSAVRSLPGGGA